LSTKTSLSVILLLCSLSQSCFKRNEYLAVKVFVLMHKMHAQGGPWK